MITRRTWLKGVTAGAGSVVFSPLIQSLAAQVEGKYTPPKRFVFVLTDNGFYEDSAQPVGVPLEGDLRQLPLGPLTLSKDIDPFVPYKDRLLIVQGLRARHLHPDHGAGFGALSGVTSPGAAKFSVAAAESIDAAIARVRPGIFPLLVLGIAPGSPSISSFYASSAWGRGGPSRPSAVPSWPMSRSSGAPAPTGTISCRGRTSSTSSPGTSSG